MAKLTFPLMSLSAHGTIAKNLTFSERKTGNQVRWQKKQKDVLTTARETQRNKFKSYREAWDMFDFGVQEFGYILAGGKEIEISRLPKNKRAPKYACFIRDWLS